MNVAGRSNKDSVMSFFEIGLTIGAAAALVGREETKGSASALVLGWMADLDPSSKNFAADGPRALPEGQST